jgi:hypothetical protein
MITLHHITSHHMTQQKSRGTETETETETQ